MGQCDFCLQKLQIWSTCSIIKESTQLIRFQLFVVLFVTPYAVYYRYLFPRYYNRNVQHQPRTLHTDILLAATRQSAVTYIVSYLRHSLFRLKLAVCECCPHQPYDLFQDKRRYEPRNICAQALVHCDNRKNSTLL